MTTTSLSSSRTLTQHHSSSTAKPSLLNTPQSINDGDNILEDDTIIQEMKQYGNAGYSKGSKAGLWWTAAAWIAYNHVVALLTVTLYHNVSTSIILYTLFQAYLQVLGITAGYHRLWSHRSYTATLPLRAFLAIVGLQAFQGSARWWALRHRLHHRFTDTDLDPYNASRGFVYSHIGWLFTPPPAMDRMKLINAKDLDHDVVVNFQKKYLLHGYVLFGGIIPSFIGYLLGNDFLGGFLWIGMPYNRFNTAVTNLFCTIFTNGEGNHNYHHEFPFDYRAGWKITSWDPCKWFIYTCYALGLVTELQRMPINEIEKKRIQVLEEYLAEEKKHIQYPPDDSQLPTMTGNQVQEKIDEDKKQSGSGESKEMLILIILDGYVLDVTKFQHQHPGGHCYLQAFNGRDATSAFHGTVNTHTVGSTNMAHMMRVAKFID